MGWSGISRGLNRQAKPKSPETIETLKLRKRASNWSKKKNIWTSSVQICSLWSRPRPWEQTAGEESSLGAPWLADADSAINPYLFWQDWTESHINFDGIRQRHKGDKSTFILTGFGQRKCCGPLLRNAFPAHTKNTTAEKYNGAQWLPIIWGPCDSRLTREHLYLEASDRKQRLLNELFLLSQQVLCRRCTRSHITKTDIFQYEPVPFGRGSWTRRCRNPGIAKTTGRGVCFLGGFD